MIDLKKMFLFICSLMAFSQHITSQENPEGFVSVSGQSFVIDGSDYSFIGTNYWQGMNLGAREKGDRKRLTRELDHLKSLGINNLRVLAASEGDQDMKYCIHPALQTAPGVYDEDVFVGLDFLLSEMAKRKMKAVMVLGNFWTWSGGFPQYLKWSDYGPVPFPQDPEYSWQEFTDYSQQFYNNNKAQGMMNDHIKTVIERKNSITGILYKNDPTIMSWQLANEPRGYDIPEAYRVWTKKTSAFIKSLDQNHLVCLGSEGNTADHYAGVNVQLDNDDENIDYITMHIWAQNWGWFDPTQGEEKYQEAIEKVDNYWDVHLEAGKQLNKPIVLEEFGIARDNSSFDPEESTLWRDRFFDHLFDKVSESIQNGEGVRGLNFWSYSGTVRPPRPGEYWENGDVFTGDPPHELQGWYGVYDTDKSTLELIEEYTDELK